MLHDETGFCTFPYSWELNGADLIAQRAEVRKTYGTCRQRSDGRINCPPQIRRPLHHVGAFEVKQASGNKIPLTLCAVTPARELEP